MFSQSAEVYDLVYGSKPYAEEAARIAGIVRAAKPAALTLLDVACGTGAHARHLAGEHGFRVDGIDLDAGLLGVARRKLPGADLRLADMRDFRLGRLYDAVTCLFGSIGYVRDVPDLHRAVASMAMHLAPDGVLLVEPWFEPGVLQPGYLHSLAASADGVHVCRLSRTEIDGRLSRLELCYLIGTAAGIQHRREIHELGIFTREEMADAFRAAGLTGEHDAEGLAGRGLWTARPA